MSERNPGQAASHGRSCLEVDGYNCSLMGIGFELHRARQKATGL